MLECFHPPPYQYGANSPAMYVDINGDSTYLVIYGAGYLNFEMDNGANHDLGDGFEKSAEAYAKSIRNREGFDPERDAVIIVGVKNVKQFTEATNAEYKTGKIAELTVFSHGGSDGIYLGGESPEEDGVSLEEATAQLEYDLREINFNTYGQVDRGNFEEGSCTNFLGCQVGGKSFSEAPSSFAQTFANYLGDNRTVRAFSGYSEFPTKNGDGKSLQYSGKMVMTRDRKSQLTRLTVFQKDKPPVTPDK